MTDSSSTELSDQVLTETKSNGELTASGDVNPPKQDEYLQGVRLLCIVISMMLAVFCVALDNTIIATAIPHMTDTFKTVDDIGWYGSAYLLTTCCKFFHILQYYYITELIRISIPTTLREVLPCLQRKMGFSSGTTYLRNWICNMRCRAVFVIFHRWSSNCRSWSCWDFHWCHYHHCAFATETDHCWSIGRIVWDLFYTWATGSFYLKGGSEVNTDFHSS